MKTKHTKLGVLVGSMLLTTAIPAFAAASATGAANAAAGAAAGAASANAAANRPMTPPSAAGSASAAAGIAREPGAANAAADASARGRSSDATGLANANARASEQGRTHGLAVAAAASGGISLALAPDETAKAIHDAPFADRVKLTKDVETRLTSSDKLVTELENDAKTADNRSRAAIAKSLVEVRKQQKEVRNTLKAAAKASGDNWGKIQSDLAKGYGDLAHAVADAEVAAKASVTANK